MTLSESRKLIDAPAPIMTQLCNHVKWYSMNKLIHDAVSSDTMESIYPLLLLLSDILTLATKILFRFRRLLYHQSIECTSNEYASSHVDMLTTTKIIAGK